MEKPHFILDRKILPDCIIGTNLRRSHGKFILYKKCKDMKWAKAVLEKNKFNEVQTLLERKANIIKKPRYGWGIVMNNGSNKKPFWIIKVKELYYSDDTIAFNEDDINLLVKYAEYFNKSKYKLREPTSYGAGLHISILSENISSKRLANLEIVHFRVNQVSQYMDGSYWVVMNVEFPSKKITSEYHPHISIGQG